MPSTSRERHDPGAGPVDHPDDRIGRSPCQGAAAHHRTSRAVALERPDDQGSAAHLYGDDPAQDRRRDRHVVVQGQGHDKHGRQAIDDGGLRAPLSAAYPHRPGPRRTTPDRTVPSPTGTIGRWPATGRAAEAPAVQDHRRNVVSMTARPPPRARRGPAWRSAGHRLFLLVGRRAGDASRRAASPTPPPRSGRRPGRSRPIQYEESPAHAARPDPFRRRRAGHCRRSRPRRSDRWTVGGVRPRALPAGRLTGRAIRVGRRDVAAPSDRLTHRWTARRRPARSTLPYVDSATLVPAQPAAAVDPGGLKREVFGFLPYWELTDSSTRLDWEKLSTVAYFGVGATGNGDLQQAQQRRLDDGRLERLDELEDDGVIDAAHANGTRVVLTVQSFGWSSTGVSRQKALLGSLGNRANLARQIAAAVRDRGRRRRQPRFRADRRRPTPTSSPRWSGRVRVRARQGPSAATS